MFILFTQSHSNTTLVLSAISVSSLYTLIVALAAHSEWCCCQYCGLPTRHTSATQHTVHTLCPPFTTCATPPLLSHIPLSSATHPSPQPHPLSSATPSSQPHTPLLSHTPTHPPLRTLYFIRESWNNSSAKFSLMSAHVILRSDWAVLSTACCESV